MSTLKVGDLVRITSKATPLDVMPPEGSRGVIEKLSDDGKMAQIVLLDEAGGVIAAGGHPTWALALEDHDVWKAAQQAYQLEMAALANRYAKRQESWEVHVAKIAVEYNLTPETTQALYDRLSSWEGFDEY